MREPSPEAKRAAEEWVTNMPVGLKLDVRKADFAKGYDTATAKLTQRVEVMEKQQVVLERMLSDRDKEQESQPDANQQPSAPTADVEFKQVKGVDLRPTYEELEAIAAERFDTIMELREARAPLVEAGKQAIPRLERCMCAGSDGHKLNLKIAKTLAALTGTGK